MYLQVKHVNDVYLHFHKVSAVKSTRLWKTQANSAAVTSLTLPTASLADKQSLFGTKVISVLQKIH